MSVELGKTVAKEAAPSLGHAGQQIVSGAKDIGKGVVNGAKRVVSEIGHAAKDIFVDGTKAVLRAGKAVGGGAVKIAAGIGEATIVTLKNAAELAKEIAQEIYRLAKAGVKWAVEMIEKGVEALARFLESAFKEIVRETKNLGKDLKSVLDHVVDKYPLYAAGVGAYAAYKFATKD